MADDARIVLVESDPATRYLDLYLAPLLPWLAAEGVTDILINRPGEVWVETLGGTMTRHACPMLSEEHLGLLARQIAVAGNQGISRAHPLLGASLPDGARVQIVAPPATRGPMAIAIRRHGARKLTLGGMAAAGQFDAARVTPPGVSMLAATPPPGGEALAQWLGDKVRARANILISGGTGSGKTTLLGALLGEIPAHERLILIEDTAELPLAHANAVGLIATRREMGEARVDVESLLQAALRMRPDRIILGEIRGREALSFLRALNTGHPGSLSSIHANSPEAALDQLALITLEAGTRLSRADVLDYVRGVIDVVVHMARGEHGRQIAAVMPLRG